MDRSFYFDKLYPLQDRALRAITNAGTEFYLSGGTLLPAVICNIVFPTT